MKLNIESIQKELESVPEIGELKLVSVLDLEEGHCVVFKNGKPQKFLVVQISDLGADHPVRNIVMETQFEQVKNLIINTVRLTQSEELAAETEKKLVRVIVAPETHLEEMGLLKPSQSQEYLKGVSFVLPIGA
jgi:hypothetical protein